MNPSNRFAFFVICALFWSFMPNCRKEHVVIVAPDTNEPVIAHQSVITFLDSAVKRTDSIASAIMRQRNLPRARKPAEIRPAPIVPAHIIITGDSLDCIE